MQTEIRTLLTIITEAALETSLLDMFNQQGVSGYTICDARGGGDHGVRDGSWGISGNIRIEIITNRPQAEQLLNYLQIHYYPHYAMIAFLQPVEILRSHKF